MKTLQPGMVIALILLAGCHKSQDLKVAKGAEGDAGAPAAQAISDQSDSKAKVPTELQTDAYHYYGLNNSKPVPMEMKVTGGPAKTGTQALEYVGMKAGKAIYTLKHTGGLTELGDTTMSLEKDGLYSTATSIGKGGDHELELPANLAIGTSWPVKSTYVTNDGRKIETEATFKVLRSEKVKVPSGTFDALYIESDGTAKFDTQNVRMKTLNWYVKDHGQVKTEIITIDPTSHKKSTYLIQETK